MLLCLLLLLSLLRLLLLLLMMRALCGVWGVGCGVRAMWRACYPSSEETCPSWAATGLREIHISGDISFATRQYWYITQDIDWLSSVGSDLVGGIATFFLSRSTPNSDGSLRWGGGAAGHLFTCKLKVAVL